MAMTSLIPIIQIWNSLKRMWQKWWSLSTEWWLSASSLGWMWQRQRESQQLPSGFLSLSPGSRLRESRHRPGSSSPATGSFPGRSSPPCGPRWVSPPEPAASLGKRGRGGRVGSLQGHDLEASLLFTSVRTYSQGHIGSTRAQKYSLPWTDENGGTHYKRK